MSIFTKKRVKGFICVPALRKEVRKDIYLNIEHIVGYSEGYSQGRAVTVVFTVSNATIVLDMDVDKFTKIIKEYEENL